MADVAGLTKTLDANLSLLARQADGVGQASSLRPLYAGGSSFNWMIGHLAVSRDAMLAAAGAEKLGGDELVATYTYGTKAPDAAAAHDVATLLELLARQGERIGAVLPTLDADALAAPSRRGGQTVEAYLTFMVWHETYHLGQAALYRGALGLDSVIG